MINRKLLLAGMAVVAANLASSGLAQAGIPAPPSPYTSNSETTFSIGIQYDFGDKQVDLVAAARSTETDKENNVMGGKVDLAIPLTGDNHMPTLRAMVLAGSPDVYGEAGLGYDFAKSQALIGAGAQGPYVNGGFNYYFGSILAPYFGPNSLGGAPSREDREPG
jgi:hypothetical protein